MARFCPILNKKVTYLYCQECDDKICEEDRYTKLDMEKIKENGTVVSTKDSLKDIIPMFSKKDIGD